MLGLTDEFDVIFNTAEIGIAKPDEAVFRHVASDLGTTPTRTAFVDDLAVNVEGAATVGMHSHRFTEPRTSHRVPQIDGDPSQTASQTPQAGPVIPRTVGNERTPGDQCACAANVATA
ncbi:MAG: HAD-IA family hydrolase [Microthrixaceae bacterium]|nr:HAD-IA family hydrolase [Microthrixaceae bacterium]